MIPIRGTTGNELDHKEQNEALHKVLRGNVSLGDGANTDNLKGAWATITTPGGANTEFNYSHNLGIVPTGFMVLSTNKAAHVYKGSTAWDTAKIYLKCDVATVSITIFILVP